jgi:putative membrane protein
VTEAPVEPFLRLEAETAPRLEALPVAVPPERIPRRLPLALLGGAVLVLGLPAVWSAAFIADLLARDRALGWIGVAVAVAGFGLVAAAIGRELSGLAQLRGVDRLRVDLVSGELDRVRAAGRRWLRHLPAHAGLEPAIDRADSPETVLALLQAGPVTALREGSDALGRRAAFQAAAITAATPSPALDALTIGWRGVRLIRQVAELHGLRPGPLAMLALLRRTALAAATVAATEMAVNAATHAAISHPLLRHVLGDVAGAGVAARRMVVLARAAATACCPLEPG